MDLKTLKKPIRYTPCSFCKITEAPSAPSYHPQQCLLFHEHFSPRLTKAFESAATAKLWHRTKTCLVCWPHPTSASNLYYDHVPSCCFTCVFLLFPEHGGTWGNAISNPVLESLHHWSRTQNCMYFTCTSEQLKECLRVAALLLYINQCILVPPVKMLVSERWCAKINWHLPSIHLWYFNTKLMHFSIKNL